MTEYTLADGTVIQVRPVPPLLAMSIVAGRADLRSPTIPIVEVESVAGTKEFIPARPGELAYEEWVQEEAEVEAKRRQIQDDFVWAYGIVGWRTPDSKEFTDRPPKSWKFPSVLEEFGMEPHGDTLGRKLDYIRIELLQSRKDVEQIQKLILGDLTELTGEEIESTLDLFPDTEE